MGRTNSLEGGSNQRNIFLSIVMTGRNDDWGGNFTNRLKFSLKSIYYQAAMSQLKVEIVMVDYNPPNDAVPMWSVVQDIVQTAATNCSFLLVTVPAGVHTALRQRPKWRSFDAHLLEYVGKNVGLRLAGGRFVLVTNPDIILGGDLIAYLAAGNLLDGTYYTLPRSNLYQEIPPDIPYVSVLRARKGFGGLRALVLMWPLTLEQATSHRGILPRTRPGWRRPRSRHRTPQLPHSLSHSPAESTPHARARTVPMRRPPPSASAASVRPPVPRLPPVSTRPDAGDFLIASAAAWRGLGGFPEVHHPTSPHPPDSAPRP